jgi:ribose transport system substrate-binding protein
MPVHDRRYAHDRSARARHQQRAGSRSPVPAATPVIRIVLVALVTLAGFAELAGCGAGAPPPVTGVSTPAPSTTTVTGTRASAPPSGSTGPAATSGSATTPVPTATALPTGTAVPFRTVATDSARGRRIGVIGPAASDSFSGAIVDSVVAQLTTAGAAVTRCDPGDDAALVLDCARRLGTQQVAGWIVVQAGNLGDALCAAGPARVPLITVGTAPLRCETAWVGADDHRAGTLAGDALGRAAAGKGHCADARLVIVTDSAENPVSDARVAGIRAGFAGRCPGTTTTPTTIDAATQDRAFLAFRAVLDAVPASGQVLVAAVNDPAALGVAAAVPDRRADRVVLVAVGGDLRARCSLATTRFWLGDAALFPDRYGEVVVPALLDALRGAAVPPAMYVVPTFLTAGTVSTYYPHDACPGP